MNGSLMTRSQRLARTKSVACFLLLITGLVIGVMFGGAR